MAAVESDLPPSIPHPIADATDSPHASNAVESIQGLDFVDDQPLVTDTDTTPLPEVTKLALDNSASALLDASLGSMKPVDITENATNQNTENTSVTGEAVVATVGPNDVEAHDISESTATLDKDATEDSLMGNDANSEDTDASLTEQAPTGLSSDSSIAATEITTDAVLISGTSASEDKHVSGSIEIKGDPIPPTNVVGEPVVGQDVMETVPSKPNEELEKEVIAIIAETDSAEQDDKMENHLVVEDAKNTVDEGEAPGAEITSVVEGTLEENVAVPIETALVEQIPPEAEAKDHSPAEDVLDSGKKESDMEADRADVSGTEVGDRIVESTVDEVHEEAMKIEPDEVEERKDESVELAVGDQSEELEPTESPAEATAASTLVNETPVVAVTAAVEDSDLRTSNVEIPADPEETLSASAVSNEEKTSEGTIVPHPDTEIFNPAQATVEEPASLPQGEVVETSTANFNEEEKEIADPLVAKSHPTAEVEADLLVEEPVIPKGEENILEVTNVGTEPVVEEVVDIIPEPTQDEVAAQKASMEMANEPAIEDIIQQAPQEQPSAEEITAPAEAEAAAVEAAADLVSEAPDVEELPSLKAFVPSEATGEPVMEKVEEVNVIEETPDVQKTDVEHEIIAEEISSKELVEEPPVADHQPPADLASEQPSEKVEEAVDEQASAVVEASQDETEAVAVEAPTNETENVLAEEISVETDKGVVEEMPAEVEIAAAEEIPVEAEIALDDETPAKVERTLEETPADAEKPVVGELPAEAEMALEDETSAPIGADVRESELPQPAAEEERSTEAPTTDGGEQPPVNETAVNVKDDVIGKVTEAVSEETIVESAPVDKDATEILHESVDIPASEKDATEAPTAPVEEKEVVIVEKDLEQVGEPEQIQHNPSVREGGDIVVETAEVPTSVESVPVVEAELDAEEAAEAAVSENLAVNTLATGILEQDTVEAPIVQGKQDLEESKVVTVEESAPHDQLSEAVFSHEIGDTGAVTLEDATQEAMPSMDDSLVSEISEADTTTETIIVPEPIVQKKPDSIASVEELGVSHADEVPIVVHDDIKDDKLQLDIPKGAIQMERPKSPWTPSFQVTTIGQGVSLPSEEDIPVHSLDDSEEATAVSSEEAPIAVNDDAPVNVSQDESEEKDELKSTSSLWTPSYTVHSQGSPSPPYATLEQESSAVADKEAEVEIAVSPVEQSLVHEDVVPSTAEKPELEHVESQPTEAEQVEEVAVETTSVTEEPIAVIENMPEPPVVQEPSNEVFVEEISIPVPAIQEQDISATPGGVEEESPKEDQPALETAPTELQASEQHSAEDGSSLTPSERQSNSASPSWVPSYSVSRQGSPLPRPIPLPSADISEIRLAPPQTDTSVQEDIHNDTLEDEASPVTAPTVVVDGAEIVEVEKVQPVEDRPTTSWTPSYSVIVQGADVLDEAAIESFLPPAQLGKGKEPEVRQRRSLSEEMEPGAFSPTALIGAGFAGGAAVYAASAALRNSNDGRTSIDYAEPQMQQEKPFPTVEIPEGKKYHSAPRLDGNDASHAAVARSPDSSPISSRKRLESTTSSRLFPGGWFSASSTIPDERTSLEVAQGEFAGKQGESVEQSLQSPTSPTFEPITPVREQSSSDKRKWCIIM